MQRTSAVLAIFVTTLAATPVFADHKASDKHAGKKGYVTAYDSDQSTVLDVQSCDAKNNSHDYVECGKSLRERVKEDLCKKRGKGKHEWFYQVSDGNKMKNTAICK